MSTKLCADCVRAPMLPEFAVGSPGGREAIGKKQVAEAENIFFGSLARGDGDDRA
jgi:hypothetical protein